MERYQGIVPLDGTTLASAADTYFKQSEQIPRGCGSYPGRCWRGARNHPLAGRGHHGAALAGGAA
jgi:hypothetical protein